MDYYIIKHNVPHIPFNELVKTDNKGGVDWIIKKEEWGFDWDSDRYFTEEDIERLEPTLKAFVKSEFCEVTEL